MTDKQNTSAWRIIEAVIFYTALIANVSIVYATKYFSTLDAGSHAYNANILYELLFQKDSVFKDYYTFNPDIVPNSTSYFILLLLKPFTSFYVAEKILFSIFFICTPLFFRSIVKRLNPENLWLSNLIFPFTHFTLVYMGFFNFTLGTMFFFMFISVYLRLKNEISIKKMIILFFAIGAVYFSHPFVFLATVLFAIAHTLSYLIFNFKTIKQEKFKWLINHTVNLLIPAALFLILTIIYFLKRQTGEIKHFLKTDELNALITQIGPLHAFGSGIAKDAFALFCIICVFIIFAFVKRVIEVKKNGWTSIIKTNDVFLGLSLLFVYFTYTQPDWDEYGGFISVRMVLFVYFFLLLWLASFNLDKRICIVLIPVYFYFCVPINLSIRESLTFSNKNLKKMEMAFEKLEPNKTLIPFYFADYLWQGVHYPNYLGADKAVVVLDNYEANTKYFPIVWNEEKIPEVRVGPRSVEGFCMFWKSGKRPDWKKADYVLIFGEKPGNPCYDEVKKIVEDNYDGIFKKEDIVLYKLRGT